MVALAGEVRREVADRDPTAARLLDPGHLHRPRPEAVREPGLVGLLQELGEDGPRRRQLALQQQVVEERLEAAGLSPEGRAPDGQVGDDHGLIKAGLP